MGASLIGVQTSIDEEVEGKTALIDAIDHQSHGDKRHNDKRQQNRRLVSKRCIWRCFDGNGEGVVVGIV